MQRPTFIPAWLSFASLFLAGLTLAQAPPPGAELLEEEVPEVRRYTVELIVFRYAEEVSVGTEVFAPEVIEPEIIGAEIIEPEIMEQVVPEDVLALEQETDENAEDEEPLFQMVLLGEDELTLVDTFDRLDRLDAYEPLLHIGWTQTALPEDATPALDLREFGEPPDGLHGAFTLYLSRYLHLVVDLELDAESEGEDADVFLEPRYYDEPVYAPLRYSIDENRLFKNGETRYFDHPKFGVVAKILRFEEPEVEEIPDDTEFLSPAVVSDQGI